MTKARPPRQLGYTMLVLLDQGKLLEIDGSKRVRWQITGLQSPLDAQYLEGDRVLVAEYGGNRVTERNLKGEVLWEKKFTEPLMAQRLANGHTFVATRTALVELNRKGKEVFRHTPVGSSVVMRASKLKGGDIVYVAGTRGGTQTQCVRLDAAGKERSRFRVEVGTFGGRVEGLPNGRVLVPEMAHNRVVEYDREGKMVWEAAVSQPIVATRLPNGRTLVTSMSPTRAVELDRSGRQVWEYRSDTRVSRAWRR
jgi:hypothetical protein